MSYETNKKRTDYKSMKEIQKAEHVPFPSADPSENFEFSCTADAGSFTFHFKWLNDRWNLWVTLPDGSIRQAGVEPNVTSWTGFDDYGLIFRTSLPEIDYSSLFLTEMVLITWL